MDGTGYRALAAAGLLLVAGCSGLAPGATPTETATPAPVPTPTSTPTEFAPGLTETGVTDPGRLAAAHVRSLNAETSFRTSYALRSSYVERHPNGTVATRVRTRHAIDSPQSLHRVSWTGNASGVFEVGQVRAPRGRAETYCAIGRCLLAVTAENTTTYREQLVLGPSLLTAISTRHLGDLLGAAETTDVRPVEHNGSTHYRLRMTGVRDPAAVPAPAGFGAVRNVSFTALVAPSGFIREYRLTYTGRRAGRRVRVTETVRFSGVGATAVDRPAWLDEARDAT